MVELCALAIEKEVEIPDSLKVTRILIISPVFQQKFRAR